MKTRYIFTDSSLETIYNSFVVESDEIHETMISDLQEINEDKSIRKNIIFFNSEFLNSCSLNEYNKSDNDKCKIKLTQIPSVDLLQCIQRKNSKRHISITIY